MSDSTAPAAAPDAPTSPAAAPTTPATPPSPAPATAPVSGRPMATPTERRIKGIGFAFVAVGALLIFQLVPVLVALADYEGAVLDQGPGLPGGDLHVSVIPAGVYNVTLRDANSDAKLVGGETDATGNATFHAVPHAVIVLAVTRDNATVRGFVFAPEGGNATVRVLTSAGNQKWLGETPVFSPVARSVLFVVVALCALIAAGGAALILRKLRPLALVGSGSAVVLGLLGILVGGATMYGLIGLIIGGLGVWAFLTMRKDPTLFARRTL